MQLYTHCYLQQATSCDFRWKGLQPVSLSELQSKQVSSSLKKGLNREVAMF